MLAKRTQPIYSRSDPSNAGTKHLVVLVTAAAYFAATFLGQQLKLRILTEKLLVISHRFFGIPPFRLYALADGIRRIPSGSAFQPTQESPPGRATRTRPHLVSLKILGNVPYIYELTITR